MQLYDSPWPHGVVDSFYDPVLFQAMRKELIDYFSDVTHYKPRNRIQCNEPEFARFTDTVLCLLSVDFEKFLSYFPDKRDYSTLQLFHEVSFIADGYEYPLHCENENKVLTFVNYVAPVQSTGTLIYDKDKNFCFEAEWKENRSLVFAGKSGVTWHKYNVQAGKPRLTVNSFLIKKPL